MSGVYILIKSSGNLIYDVATKATGSIEGKRAFLAKYVANSKITSSKQLELAIAYIKKNAATTEVNVDDFEKSCGVSFI